VEGGGWTQRRKARAPVPRVSRAAGQIKQALGVSADLFGSDCNLGCGTGLYGLDLDFSQRPLRLRRG
jgi:hypothetical protein